MLNLQKYAFFLDFDGTLIDIVPNYNDINIPADLPDILTQLYLKTGGAVTIITGRSITNITQYLQLNLPIAGLHGSEYLEDGEFFSPILSNEFQQAKNYIKQNCADNLLLEDKHINLAIHYKDSPTKAIDVAKQALAKFALSDYTLEFTHNVVELKLKDFSKATALRHFMAKAPFQGRIPICFGDDLTDETMFNESLRHNGVAFQILSDPQITLKRNWPKFNSSTQLRNYLQNILSEAA